MMMGDTIHSEEETKEKLVFLGATDFPVVLHPECLPSTPVKGL